MNVCHFEYGTQNCKEKKIGQKKIEEKKSTKNIMKKN